MVSPKKMPTEYNLWDGFIKPATWYLSDEGKAAYLAAFENLEEMNAAIAESNWISIIFNVCYQSSKKPIAQKKNWLIKYFYEYMLSRYSVKMASNEHTLVLMTAMAGNCPTLYPYPDCLDEKKHPILHFFGSVKHLLPEGYSEQTYPILKDIVQYIYNAVALSKDVSRESWMYEKSFYVDDRERPKKYAVVLERLKYLARFPECLIK